MANARCCSSSSSLPFLAQEDTSFHSRQSPSMAAARSLSLSSSSRPMVLTANAGEPVLSRRLPQLKTRHQTFRNTMCCPHIYMDSALTFRFPFRRKQQGLHEDKHNAAVGLLKMFGTSYHNSLGQSLLQLNPLVKLLPFHPLRKALEHSGAGHTQEDPLVLERADDDILEVKGETIQKNAGRCGVASFYTCGNDQPQESEVPVSLDTNNWWVSSFWVLGPIALVSSVVLPPFFLRKVFKMILEDSLVTDFLILFFTETLFYMGVAIFLLIAHKVQLSTGVATWKSSDGLSLGYKVSTIITMILAVMLPVGAFSLVWPWTGPAAAAALFPYLASLAVQYGFEQFVREKKSSVWPLIPIVFQVYRLHQLNRATQLVAGLLYSLRGAEATAEALAVNGSLQTLVSVLQLLGMLCLWSLGAFLTHIFAFESQSRDRRIPSSA